MCGISVTCVQVHVLQQRVFRGQCFGAYGADEGLFSRMHALMNQKSVFLGKTLATNTASEWFFTCMKGKWTFISH